MATVIERRQAALKAAEDIVSTAKAAGRELDAAETAKLETHIGEARKMRLEMEHGLEVKAKLDLLGDMGGDSDPLTRRKASQRWGERIEEQLDSLVAKSGSPGSAKALIAGTLDVPSIIREAPELIDGAPTRILDLIPRRPAPPTNGFGPGVGNTFEWVKQTVRNLNAGGVPDNALKPTSEVTFTPVEDRFHTYAHLAGPMPKRFLDDYRQLIEVLRVQLGEGLMESLEFDVLKGTGTVIPEELDEDGEIETQGEDPVKGILNTSGVQTQAYATSVLNTLSAARYKLTDSFESPNAWIMNSADVRALEMLTETGTGAFLFGSGRSTLRQVLGDYPIVTSSIMTAGVALLGDFTKTELVIREDDHLDLDGSGELFKRNQVLFRHEGRYGFAVTRPHAFVTVDLTA